MVDGRFSGGNGRGYAYEMLVAIDGYTEAFELHGSRVVEMCRDERKYEVVRVCGGVLGNTIKVKSGRGW